MSLPFDQIRERDKNNKKDKRNIYLKNNSTGFFISLPFFKLYSIHFCGI